MLGGEGKSGCTLSKMSQLLYLYMKQSTFLYYTFGGKEGVCKKSTLCTLVKMLKIMYGP